MCVCSLIILLVSEQTVIEKNDVPVCRTCIVYVLICLVVHNLFEKCSMDINIKCFICKRMTNTINELVKELVISMITSHKLGNGVIDVINVTETASG